MAKKTDRGNGSTTKPESKTIAALFIKSKSPNSFRRCGFGFTKDGHGIALDALSESQIARLKSDPHLIVEDVEIDADQVVGASA